MTTPQSTPIRHAKLGIASMKSLPLANEYKKLFSDQHQRLSLKHQQDLDLLDDIRSYVKSRLSIEKDYSTALSKLAKQHSGYIAKKFALLHQLEDPTAPDQENEDAQRKSKRRGLLGSGTAGANNDSNNNNNSSTNNNPPSFEVPESACSLYKVWSEHVNRVQCTAKIRSDQFEQLTLLVSKLKDIRAHKAHIGKKCLDTHLKRIQEDMIVSMVELERARKLYYEDESQAKKARENEEKIKKKRSGLLTKFTDLQAKKEKSSAQREATDIQSTQARNDYIMALAAANAHLDYYYKRDLEDFIQLIDDGVLDHCKIFMATLSECDINSLKDSLAHAQFWSKLIAVTGLQQTNSIFLECEQSQCLQGRTRPIEFEPCNNDPINKISLEHNADYALQHEIDKWFTWFKKECRNFSHLMHQLETCQNALADGKKSIEFNNQTIDDLEPKIIELKQQIRKCEAAKLKAQARLKVIKEGGMPIEEWSAVESEIAADMARAQEEQERARQVRESEASKGGPKSTLLLAAATTTTGAVEDDQMAALGEGGTMHSSDGRVPVQLQISRDSDEIESDAAALPLGATTPLAGDSSMHNLASVSRSTTGYLNQKQQNAISGYSALTDPSLVWQDDYSSTGVWGGSNTTTIQAPPASLAPETVVVMTGVEESLGQQKLSAYEPRGMDQNNNSKNLSNNNNNNVQQISAQNKSIQSSSPLSAIVANSNGQQLVSSPYQTGMMSEAYKSDYECDYNLPSSGQPQQEAQPTRSPASSNETHNIKQGLETAGLGEFGKQIAQDDGGMGGAEQTEMQVGSMLNKRVLAMYAFEKSNEDDLAFEENDILVIIDVNQEDTNWVRARHTQSGLEGYVPVSYVRLAEQTTTSSLGENHQFDDDSFDKHQEDTTFGGLGGDTNTASQSAAASGAGFCRALYDYQPPEGEAPTEEDGLPHLSLQQGDIMSIVDQGEDDGWWLVEKDDGTRGHVPSMLVEELDEDEEEDAVGQVGEHQESAEMADEFGENSLEFDGDNHDNLADDNDDDHDESMLPPPPSFEAPKLELDDPESQDKRSDGTKPEASSGELGSNLVATSFVIIEPTPEVESKRFGEEEGSEDDETALPTGRDETKPEVGSRHTRPPSSDVSYSVVKEDFVLEKPTRKPYAGSMNDLHQHHEPTIQEEDGQPEGGSGDNKCQLNAQNEALSKNNGDNRNDEDDHDHDGRGTIQYAMPSVSVVIDTVEFIPRSPDESFDQEERDESAAGAGQSEASDSQPVSSSNDANSGQEPASSKMNKIKNVDCSPILRHHAEEFSKMIIEEALMLAPGSGIGPSTSSASIGRDGDDDDHETHNYSDEE